MSTLIELPRGQVHIWTGLVEKWAGTPAMTALSAALSAEEKERAARFAFERDRDVYSLAHGMLRQILSRYESNDAATWTFENNAHGKPHLVPESSLRFNISHTGGLAVLAVMRDFEVGVDVESLLRTRVRIEVASKAFTPIERHGMLACTSEEARRERFFETWTLKEAFIKAKGRGLSLPLDQFWFQWSDSGELLFNVDAALNETPSDWQFEFLRDVPNYLIAVALKPERERYSLIHRHFTPDS